MKNNRIFIGIVLLLISYLIISAYILKSDKKNDQEKKQILTIWGSDYSIKDTFEEYQKSNPNSEIEFTYFTKDEYIKRIESTIAISGELPDICFLSRDSYMLSNMDIWEDLSEAPYSLDKKDFMENTLLINEKNKIIGVPYYITATGMAYRRDLANKVLGSDSEIYVSSIFSSWADLISQGNKIKKQFGDDIYMFSSVADAGVMLLNQTNEKYMENNKLIKPERFKNYFKVLINMRDNGLIKGTTQWSPKWYESFEDENILFYPCPIWLSKIDVFNQKSLWGLTLPPGGSFNWGGENWAIPKNSKNKELAWDFMKSFIMSNGGARYNQNKENGVLICYKPAYEMIDYGELYHRDFGNQNIGKAYFDMIIPNMYSRELDQEEELIEKAYYDALNMIMYDRNSKTEEVYQYFIELITVNGGEVYE